MKQKNDKIIEINTKRKKYRILVEKRGACPQELMRRIKVVRRERGIIVAGSLYRSVMRTF